MVDAGFTGSETTVRDAVAKWRKQSNAPAVSPGRPPSASRFIESMCQKEPQLKMAQQLSLDFYRMLKTKNKLQLNQWFSDVSQSGLVPDLLCNFNFFYSSYQTSMLTEEGTS